MAPDRGSMAITAGAMAGVVGGDIPVTTEMVFTGTVTATAHMGTSAPSPDADFQAGTAGTIMPDAASTVAMLSTVVVADSTGATLSTVVVDPTVVAVSTVAVDSMVAGPRRWPPVRLFTTRGSRGRRHHRRPLHYTARKPASPPPLAAPRNTGIPTFPMTPCRARDTYTRIRSRIDVGANSLPLPTYTVRRKL